MSRSTAQIKRCVLTPDHPQLAKKDDALWNSSLGDQLVDRIAEENKSLPVLQTSEKNYYFDGLPRALITVVGNIQQIWYDESGRRKLKTMGPHPAK